MPGLESLKWSVGKHEHHEALKRFVCASPPEMIYDPHRGRYHPAPWEMEVQSGLRGLRLPVPDSEGLLFSFDGQGEIASAVHFSFDAEGEQILILAIATRSDLRGQGLGRRTLTMALEIIANTKAVYSLDLGVWARIRRGNAPSKALFSAVGFECIEDSQDPETWLLGIPLPVAPS